MGGSRSIINNHGGENPELCVEKHSLRIISDNSRQFDNQEFRTLCSRLGIKNQFFSLGHPQANEADKSDKLNIVEDHQIRLEGVKGTWLEELPNVLWAYQTTVRTPTGKTPFRLTYGTKAMISDEIGITSMKENYFKKAVMTIN